MKNQIIQRHLFVLASIATPQANVSELTLIEELPIEKRGLVHKAVVDFLKNNPEVAATAKVIAIDRNGVVYVLDENKVFLPLVGEPSCVTM